MKKLLIILVVIGVFIVGFLVFKNKVSAPEFIQENPASETSPTEGNVPQSSPATSVPKTYSYKNDEFHFAVNLPGLVMKKRDETNAQNTLLHPIVFTFGPEDQKTPNTMAVYIWKNKAEFDLLVIQMTPTKETVNGREFNKYVITEGDTTVYRYATTVGDVIYDVGVFDPKNISKFYLLK